MIGVWLNFIQHRMILYTRDLAILVITHADELMTAATTITVVAVVRRCCGPKAMTMAIAMEINALRLGRFVSISSWPIKVYELISLAISILCKNDKSKHICMRSSVSNYA